MRSYIIVFFRQQDLKCRKIFGLLQTLFRSVKKSTTPPFSSKYSLYFLISSGINSVSTRTATLKSHFALLITPPFSGTKTKTTALFYYDNVQKLHFKAYIVMICLRKQPYLLYIFNAISSILKRICVPIEIL